MTHETKAGIGSVAEQATKPLQRTGDFSARRLTAKRWAAHRGFR